jgi:hypothetical protein
MLMLTRRSLIKAGAGAIVSVAGGAITADALPEAPFRSGRGWKPLLNGRDLSGWHAEYESGGRPPAGGSHEWYATPAVNLANGKAEKDALRGGPDGGPIVVNGRETHTTNLVSDAKFSDCELYVEFVVASGSNSGVYVQGQYEVQIFDSYGRTEPLRYSDAGGIYEYGLPRQKGSGGTPARTNASRPPGTWQSYHITFRAPRFDASGKKTANARFEKVLYNGTVIHDGVECTGPTRSALDIAEAPRNPIMLQGDHGPVAFRNVFIRER